MPGLSALLRVDESLEGHRAAGREQLSTIGPYPPHTRLSCGVVDASMSDVPRDSGEGKHREETADRERLAPRGSPGGAAAFSAVLWGLVAYFTTESILVAGLVFLAVLTSLEAIAGFATERTD